MKKHQLVKWREHVGLSQQVASELLDCSLRHYQNMEYGATRISNAMSLACAAIALGITAYEGPQ